MIRRNKPKPVLFGHGSMSNVRQTAAKVCREAGLDYGAIRRQRVGCDGGSGECPLCR